MRHYRMAFQNLKKPISRSICIIILEIRTAINISIKQSIVFLPFFMYNDFGKGPNHGRRTLRGGADVGQALFPLVPSIGQRLGKRCGGFMRNQKKSLFPLGKSFTPLENFPSCITLEQIHCVITKRRGYYLQTAEKTAIVTTAQKAFGA